MARRRRNGRHVRNRIFAALAAAVLLLVLLRLSDSGLLPGLAPGEPSPASTPEGNSPWQELSEEAFEGLEVYFLDVGQGDSELVRFHSGGESWNMLIDTGEYQYADGLTETLRGLGVEKLDALVLSHPHTDHMGCAARIVERFDIGAVYMPRVSDEIVPTTAAYEALLDALAEKELKALPLDQSTVFASLPAGLQAQIFAPRTDADWDDLNNWSGVFCLTFGEIGFLFTGDAEIEALDDLREDGSTYGWDLKTAVLKCGHHGSSNASPAKWLKAVSPGFAVISCAADNSYGHPHRETLERLNKLGAEIYRTDEQGTIRARTDGETLSWKTNLPSVEK